MKKFIKYFNSIKVRLERLRLCDVEVVLIFQFHKGAIRTAQGVFVHRFF